jgi:hypothetical protein
VRAIPLPLLKSETVEKSSLGSRSVKAKRRACPAERKFLEFAYTSDDALDLVDSRLSVNQSLNVLTSND